MSDRQVVTIKNHLSSTAPQVQNHNVRTTKQKYQCIFGTKTIKHKAKKSERIGTFPEGKTKVFTT